MTTSTTLQNKYSLKGYNQFVKVHYNVVFRSSLSIFLLFLIVTSTITASNGEPTLTLGKATPGQGLPNTEFTFTVTYTDSENDAPLRVKAVIDQVEYDMLEVNKEDNDYIDGKEYYYKRILDEGTYVVFFRAYDVQGNVTDTNSFNLVAANTGGHQDLINYADDELLPMFYDLFTIVMILLVLLLLTIILIFIFIGMQIRKVAKQLESNRRQEDTEVMESEGQEETKQEDLKNPEVTKSSSLSDPGLNE